jgi:hypothetical protein
LVRIVVHGKSPRLEGVRDNVGGKFGAF